MSDPRVAAPEAPSDYAWPHVESGGVLCLPALQRSVSAADRVLKAIEYAFELGAYDQAKRKEEFQREFKAYWDHVRTAKAPVFWSLVSIDQDPPVVWYYHDWQNGRYVFGESKEQLRDWLRNAGANPGDKQLLKSPLATMDDPPIPNDFPKLGKDILKGGLSVTLERFLTPGVAFPILVRIRTETGTVFAGVILQTPPENELRKGFRSIHNVPWDRIATAVGARPILRCSVERIDPQWIHGRDHNHELGVLKDKQVVVIGCGAIGASLARLLVQAGVFNLALVDNDNLSSANVSRHVLGQEFVGNKKVDALASMLQRDFPHIREVVTHGRKIQAVGGADLYKLGKYDLIISAGIDLLGDDYIDRWRMSLDAPPAHLATWSEEFAVAAHAVLVIGKDTLLRHFDDRGHPRFVATTWDSSATRVVEAGCGNVFQPHGAIDLSNAITLASRLALDALLGVAKVPCRRVWLSDRANVAGLGGATTSEFTESNVVREIPLR